MFPQVCHPFISSATQDQLNFHYLFCGGLHRFQCAQLSNWSVFLLFCIKVDLLWDLQLQSKGSLTPLATILSRSNLLEYQKCYFYSFKWTEYYL